MNTTDHILKNTEAIISITFTSGNAVGDVTYAVTDAEGAAVQSGTALSEMEPGRYSFQLAPQATVKRLTVVWTGSWGGVSQSISTHAEIVGAYLFTIAQARAYDNAKLASTVTYTDAAIREARAGITELFEAVTGVSFIPRYHRETLDGGTGDLWLNRRQARTLLSSSVDAVALTAPEIADVEVYESGRLYRTAGWNPAGRRGITVAYEHGYQAVPWDIHQAALVLLRYTLVSSDIGDRVISWSNDLGTYRAAIAGAKYPTGIPAVDAALSRYTSAMVLA